MNDTHALATQLFDDLKQAVRRLPDYAVYYNQLNRVLQQCLDELLVHSQLNFGGTFAKLDYLLKEHHAPRELAQDINATRARLRGRLSLDPEQQAAWSLHDLSHLCRFIAFACDVPVPDGLSRLFPTERREEPQATLLGERLRVIVVRWDDVYVYATAEDPAALAATLPTEPGVVRVCYGRGNKVFPQDWSYLGQLFHRGAQLNLVRPRLEEGTLYPELIIYEPDYLVDISTVAQCFTNYAESPWVHLLKKLEPAQTSEAIILGNFAGQLLDEEIHRQEQAADYRASVQTFWRHNALGMLNTQVSADFHTKAQAQQRNIAHALSDVLPQSVASFNPKECMVEPSFFSELLGLQGRMDFLQLDYKILVEQKSGKGEFPYDGFVKPKRREEHYVQMLLYMMLIRYNFRAAYEGNLQELHAFLLYSMYRESLLGMSFAPDLMFRAIKVRNELAWSEFHYTEPGALRCLATRTPEQFNEKQVSNKLWYDYQRPQIEALLAPIHEASPLERAYYFRFLTFIENEHLLSKLGNMTKANSGFAAKWYDSLEDKLQAGNIYDHLKLLSPNAQTAGSIDRVRLQFAETASNNMSNFRVGDIVILYAYEPGQEPDVRRQMVFRCTIEHIEATTIDLTLRAAQTDARVFLRHQDQPWAIEHDFFESSYNALYRGMHAFLSAPQARRDLLLLQRAPEVDPTRSLNGDYGAFNTLMTRVKQARDLFLIIGPPGTGKTSFGLLNTLLEELTEPDSSVLLLSYTNRAVDEICSKLVEEQIDFIRLGSHASCAPEYQDRLLSHRATRCNNLTELRALILQTRVVVGTTTAMDANQALLQLRPFSLAIIDEASQILEPHLMGILSAKYQGNSSIRKMVFIGDHKQLPAVVQQVPEVSRVDEPLLHEVLLTDCRLSLFERLLKKYHADERVVYMLHKQGRMHPDIAQFPNDAFYQGQLDVVPREHQTVTLPATATYAHGIDALLQTRRIAFLHADLPEQSLSDKVNLVEAEMIAATVLRIYERERDHFEANKTVGVIVPYRNQIATVRNLLDRSGIRELHDITIDTVERYQGSQRRYILYGFTVQQPYQLSFLTNNVFRDFDGSLIDRKLNVAMTRAEEHLILVGNTELLRRDPIFSRLIDWVQERHGYFRIATADYLAGHFQV